MSTITRKSRSSDPEVYLQHIFMQAPISLMLLMGEELTIKMANERAVLVTGSKREDLIGKPFFEAFPNLMFQGFKDTLLEVYHSGVSFRANEVPLQRSLTYGTGIEFVNVVLDPIKDSAGQTTGILAVGMDVTGLVRSRRKEEAIQTKYKQLFDAMNQAFFTLEVILDENNSPVDYRYLEVNPAFERVSDYHDVVGKTAKDILSENADFWIREFGEVAVTGISKSVNGEANKYYESYAFPVGPAGSNHVGVILIDKSESKREQDLQKKYADELRKEVHDRTRALKRSNKELLHFARLTSHDLKEPVRKIETFVRRLNQDDEPLTEERRKHFMNRILVSVERLKKMILGVQHYTQIEYSSFPVEKIDLNTIIASIILGQKEAVGAKPVNFKTDLLPVIEGSRIHIYQLFYNLISNSLKFAKNDTPLEISISSEKFMRNGVEFVDIVITDNGIGFDPQQSEVIFESFTRLHSKDKYEGIGLGLALSKRIADKHGGMITATGFQNHGSKFIVSLPLRQKRTSN